MNKTCANCRYGEYYSDKLDIWCSQYEKWVGLFTPSCEKWDWVGNVPEDETEKNFHKERGTL